MTDERWIIRFLNSKSGATWDHTTGERRRWYTREAAEKAIAEDRDLMIRYGYQPTPMIAEKEETDE